jgi:hypothetical protein
LNRIKVKPAGQGASVVMHDTIVGEFASVLTSMGVEAGHSAMLVPLMQLMSVLLLLNAGVNPGLHTQAVLLKSYVELSGQGICGRTTQQQLLH